MGTTPFDQESLLTAAQCIGHSGTERASFDASVAWRTRPCVIRSCANCRAALMEWRKPISGRAAGVYGRINADHFAVRIQQRPA